MPHPFLDRPGWIFDMDGTLTVPVHDFAALRAQLGVPGQADILGWVSGRPAAERARLLAEIDVWEAALADRSVAQADAVALVDALRRRGARLGVLTRNTRATALRTLQAAGWLDAFAPEDVIGRDEAAAKPAPDGLHHLGARWGLDPSSLVMVGDYVYDARAGRAAGAATVLVLRADDRGWEGEADVLLRDLSELVR